MNESNRFRRPAFSAAERERAARRSDLLVAFICRPDPVDVDGYLRELARIDGDAGHALPSMIA